MRDNILLALGAICGAAIGVVTLGFWHGFWTAIVGWIVTGVIIHVSYEDGKGRRDFLISIFIAAALLVLLGLFFLYVPLDCHGMLGNDVMCG